MRINLPIGPVLFVSIFAVFIGEVTTSSCGYYYRYSSYKCSYRKTERWRAWHSCGWLWRKRCTRHYFNKFVTAYKWCYRAYRYSYNWASWGSWGSWSSCSASCSYGYKIRYRCRRCSNKYVPCYWSGARQSQSTRCYLRCCKRNGRWTGWYSWQSWDRCSRICGGGTQKRKRYRYCTRPSPYCGGSSCRGSSVYYQYVTCNKQCCRRNGGWTGWYGWQSWSTCSKHCGGGTQYRRRYRYCSKPSPSCGGSSCRGSSSVLNVRSCNRKCCRQNGGWTRWYGWQSWSSCSKTCGGGTQYRRRYRYCSNPSRSCGGSYCSGSSSLLNTRTCNSKCCRRNGGWTGWYVWQSWSTCSKTCGGGTQYRRRYRYCSNPSRSCGGSYCSGSSSLLNTRTCNSKCCRRNGGWSNWNTWQVWSTCSRTCGGGTKQRYRNRSCSNPSPGCGGTNCVGSLSDTHKIACNIQCCRHNGEWGKWNGWNDIGTCSQTCDNGEIIQQRHRKCIYPSPGCKGDVCPGESLETRSAKCQNDPCPDLCICKASGDPHYRLFDGQMIHFMGTSQYTMVKSTKNNDSCLFNIEVKNEHRYGNYRVSYTKYLDFDIHGRRIGLRKNGVALVDGEKKGLPFSSQNDSIKINNIGKNLYVKTKCGINIRFEWQHLVTVIVPGSYRNYTTGICGKCDGIQNDYVTSDGTDVSNKPNKYSLIGNSYDVMPSSNDRPVEDDWKPECNVRMNNLVTTDAYCGLMEGKGGVFDKCITNITDMAKVYFESCKIDVCENDNENAVEKIKCETVEGFAEECRNSGFDVKWRSSKFCPIICDEPNQVYKFDGPGCPLSCLELDDKENCSNPNTEGCFCKDGFVLSDNKCVPRSQCGCVEQNGDDVDYYPLGHRKVSKNCMSSYQCKHVNGKPQFVKIPSSTPCHSSADCQLNEEGERVCICKTGFYGDGYKSCTRLRSIIVPENTKRVQLSIQFINNLTTSSSEYVGVRSHLAKALSEILNISLYRIDNVKVSKGSGVVSFTVIPRRKGTKEPDMSTVINDLHRRVRMKNLPITNTDGKQLIIDGTYFQHTFHVSKPCECLGQGDPHYKTFDGEWIHFMGICKYTLTKSTLQDDQCAFNVVVKNEHRGNNKKVSYTKYVETYIMGTQIGFYKNGNIRINGSNQNLPYSVNNGEIMVSRNGRYIQLTTICDIKVKFDGDSYVKVTIPEKYRNHTTGICGVCNGIKDDFRTKDGTPVSSDRNGQALIGNSYKVTDGSVDGCDDESDEEQCSESMKEMIPRNDYCGLITNITGPFKACIENDPDMAKEDYELCAFDMCAYEKDSAQLQRAKCMALEGFAAFCEGVDIPVEWRSENTCPMVCKDPNAAYKPEGSACHPSCVNLRASSNCPFAPKEGCFCKNGYVMSGDTCVPKNYCGCIDPDGNYLPVGRRRTTDECGQEVECVKPKYGPAKLVKKTTQNKCDQNAVCMNNANGEKQCICKDNFIGDGYTFCKAIPKTFNRVSIHVRLLHNFTETVGDEEESFTKHLASLLASLLGISKSRITNLQLSGLSGSISVNFDILPKRKGSNEPKMETVLKKMISMMKSESTSFLDLAQNSLKHDTDSMSYKFDTTKECTCTGSGDPHYRTFDGQMIHFMGTSRYIMVESLDDNDDCKFHVHVKNEHRYGNVRVSYTKKVFFQIRGANIELQKGGIILVNKKREFSPFSSSQGNFEIRDIGGNLYVTTRCGVSVSFERDHLVTVKVPGRFRGNLTGICGDCDGKKNDFRTADGVDVSKRPRKFLLIGSSYNTEGEKNESILNDVGAGWKEDCSVKMRSLVKTNNYCGLLTSKNGPFNECINDDPDLASEYYESCKVDVCENEDDASLETIKCQTVQGFVEDCKEGGFHIKWRTPRFCPGQCEDPNMEYKESGPGCPPSCMNQNQQNSCSEKGNTGCFCKEGFVLSDRKCVRKTDCGCLDVKGNYYPIGHVKKSSSCIPSEECKRVDGRSMFVKVLTYIPCHSMAKCKLNDKGEEACICNSGYYGDGFNCSVIPKITLSSGTKGVKVAIQFKNDFSATVGLYVGKFKEHLIKAIAEILGIPFYRISQMDLQESNRSLLASFYIQPKRNEVSKQTLQKDLNNLQRLVRTNAVPITDLKGNKLIIDPTFFKHEANVARPCRCTGSGDPHYKTYDGQVIDFMGTCKYTFTKSTTVNDTCAFNVEVTNEHRGSNTAVSYTKYVDVETFDIGIALRKDGKVLIDKQSISLPFQNADENVKIFRSGRFVRVINVCDVIVEFDGNSFVSVQIPDKYRGLTTGICGVCDDNQNDYKTKDGRDVSDSGNRDRLIGNSYKVKSSSVDGCEDEPEPSVSCTPEFQKVVESYDFCGIISNETSPFQKCIHADPELQKFYFDTCVFDVCANKDSKVLMEKMRCQVLEGLAEECIDVSISWRSEDICPLKCSQNALYTSSGTACPASCMDVRAPSNCIYPPTEGCLCKEGYVLSDEECVTLDDCGCVDDDGKYYKVGQKTVNETCGGMIYECQSRSNDTPTFIPLGEGKPCHQNASCQYDDDGKQRCICKDGFIGDGSDKCQQMPRDVRLVTVTMQFSDDYVEVIGNNNNKYRLHFMILFASLLKVSRSRITNLRIRNDSIDLEFDVLPKRVGSSEASLSEAINKLILRFSQKDLKIPILSGETNLTPDFKSFNFKIDTSKIHTCLGYGDPHYKTFDGQLIDFMGTCKYTMVKASDEDSKCAFHVKVQNEYRGGNTNVSFTKFIDFEIYGATIRLLKQKGILVNRERKNLPFQMQNADILIAETGKYVQVETGCGITVKFDGDSTVSVHVPDTYMNRTEGICGNFDGYENDYSTENGKDVSNEEHKFDLIGDSYKIEHESPEGCKRGKAASELCSQETMAEIESVTSCGIIIKEQGPFQECIEDDPVYANDFFKSCKFDVCSYEDDTDRKNTFLCQVVEAFSLHCAEIGFTVNWRSSSLCPMICNNETEIFKPYGPGCEASCKDPYAEEKCVFENIEGCFCRDGLIRSDTKCINPDLCGCVDDTGEYYELGDRKTNTYCTHSMECRKVGKKPMFIDVQTNRCHALARCDISDDGLRTCVCKEGYIGDGNTTCTSICTEPNTNYYKKGEACKQTCTTYAASSGCSTNKEKGCFCREGYALFNGSCVNASSECGCIDNENEYRQIDETWFGHKCGEEYTCIRKENGSAVINTAEGEICHDNATCERDNTGRKRCECKFSFKGDGVSVCSQICSKPNTKYYKPREACEQTCHTYAVSSGCSLNTEEGCFCRKGYAFHNGSCVDALSGCGCMDSEDKYYEINETWYGDKCGEEYTCSNVENGSFIFQLEEGYVCHENATCVKDRTEEKRCKCNFGFKGDGVHSCSPVCTEPNTKYYKQGEACNQTCHTYAVSSCPSNEEKGCFCREGYALHNEICVDASSECGCFDQDAKYHEINETWSGHRCGEKYICSNEKNGSVVSKTMEGDICHGNATCVKDYTGKKSCECIFGFKGDGVNYCSPICTEPNTNYYKEGDACKQTCQSYAAASGCSSNMNEGCFCKEGYALHNGSCVDATSECGCVDKANEYHEIDAIWSGTRCGEEYTCSNGKNGSVMTELSEGQVCHDNATCRKDGSRTESCKCIFGFRGDGVSGCTPICTEPNTKYYKTGEACNQTCHKYAASSGCSINEEKGCFCREGYALHNGNCVDASSECGCIDSKNEYHEVNETWSGFRCGEEYTCRHGDNGSVVTNVLAGDTCHDNATCVEDISGNNYCKCKLGFKGDGVSNCSSICTEPYTEYFKEGEACKQTCQSYASTSVCLPNSEEGCFCRKEFALHNGKCVDASSECGCIDNTNKYREIGETWSGQKCGMNYSCILGEKRSKLTVLYEGKTCHVKAICQPNDSGGMSCKCKSGYQGDGVSTCKKARKCFCMVFSSTRYRTYDRQMIDFTGTCKYILSKTIDPKDKCSFNISVKNEHLNNNNKRAYTKYVEVDVHGFRIKLLKNSTIQVDGKLLDSFNKPKFGLHVSKRGRFLTLVDKCGLKVQFGGRHIVKVKVPAKFRSKLTGLCGDCNGKKDDFKTSNNEVISMSLSGKAADKIAESYELSCD